MKIVDEDCLNEFRGIACCWCSKRPSEAAHIMARGHGGGLRLDVRINIVPLCRSCHAKHHGGGTPSKPDLIDIVAAREKMQAWEVLAELHRLQRLDKNGKEGRRWRA